MSITKYKYYSPEVETLPRDKMTALQSEKLRRQVQHVWDHLPYYHHLMEEKGVTPADIRGIEDLHKLPFLTKHDLRDTYPDGMRAVPMDDVVRLHATSGTTGRRVIAYYTQNDVDLWETCVARAVTAMGADRTDILQNCFGYGLFSGGFGIHGGASRVGCTVIPISAGSTERQLQFMEDLRPTILCCTPSYAAYLGEALKESGKTPDDIALRIGIFGAEPWTEEMRRDIQASLGIKAYDIYGLTEMSGPGVAFECTCQHGMHINEDHFIAEIIDPDTEEVLPLGESGELVFTSLDKEAFPLLRYRTRDICRLIPEPCACGRTFVRMEKPRGRSDDMLIIRGVNVFPGQIETVLLNENYSPNYQIVVDRVNNNDTFDIYVELNPDQFTDTVGQLSAMERALAGKMREMLGIGAVLHLVAPHTIARSEGKAVRVVDKRKLVDDPVPKQ